MKRRISSVPRSNAATVKDKDLVPLMHRHTNEQKILWCSYLWYSYLGFVCVLGISTRTSVCLLQVIPCGESVKHCLHATRNLQWNSLIKYNARKYKSGNPVNIHNTFGRNHRFNYFVTYSMLFVTSSLYSLLPTLKIIQYSLLHGSSTLY